MKKIIFLIVTIALFVSLFALPAFAVESGSGTEIEEPTQPETTDIPAIGENVEKSATQTLSAWITEHFGDITGSISAVGLAVLSWFMSKRVVPGVKKFADDVAAKSAAYEGAFKEKVDTVADKLADGVKHLEECEKLIEKQQAALQNRIEANAKAYEMQTDLINYLFLNLRVPNDLKTEVAKRSEEVKAAIKEANER